MGDSSNSWELGGSVRFWFACDSGCSPSKSFCTQCHARDVRTSEVKYAEALPLDLTMLESLMGIPGERAFDGHERDAVLDRDVPDGVPWQAYITCERADDITRA